MSGIHDRIDAALDKMKFQGMAVRAIYLNETDLAALDRAQTAAFGMLCHVCGYKDHPVRSGKRSAIYSTHGVEVTIPRRLSAKVA